MTKQQLKDSEGGSDKGVRADKVAFARTMIDAGLEEEAFVEGNDEGEERLLRAVNDK